MRSEMTESHSDARMMITAIDNLDFVLTLCLNPGIFVVSGKQL